MRLYHYGSLPAWTDSDNLNPIRQINAAYLHEQGNGKAPQQPARKRGLPQLASSTIAGDQAAFPWESATFFCLEASSLLEKRGQTR
jgi:hypothetical protein